MYFTKRDGSVLRILPVAFLALVGIFCSFSSAQENLEDWKTLVSLYNVVSSNHNFTNSVYKILSQKEGNIFFSPMSIEVALAMTYMGARGETAKQIARGLHLPEDNDELITLGFKALLEVIKSDDKTTLKVANKIFTDSAITLKEELQTQESFFPDVEAVDFKHNHEAARVQINQWVEGKTNNKIKDLLAQGVVSPDTALVLVNAIYFKGEWAKKFSNLSTQPEPFFLTSNVTKDVQMMHIRSRGFSFKASDELGCKVLELPFEGCQVSMVVILPNELDGLANLEAKLPDVELSQLLDSLRKSYVDVTLPKFKIEQFMDLKEVLTTLGMVDMFGDNANFSVLTDSPVKVSNVVHKAFIEVNEEGSEAAAATGVEMTDRSFIVSEETPKVFKADHPFLIVLRDKRTKTVLFIGRVSDASKK